MGLILLSRDTYRPQLTSEGKVFYRQAVQVLQAAQQLQNISRQLKAQVEPEVVLGVTATLSLSRILPILQALGEEYPLTDIKLVTQMMGGPVESLLNRDNHLIIASMDGVPVDEVEARPFATVRIIPVAHPEHPAARDLSLKSFKEMQHYTQVVVADSSQNKKHEQSRDILQGTKRWTVSDFSTKKQILMANMGWGGLPYHLIRNELEHGLLVELNVEGYSVRVSSLFIMRLLNVSHGVVAQKLWDQMLNL